MGDASACAFEVYVQSNSSGLIYEARQSKRASCGSLLRETRRPFLGYRLSEVSVQREGQRRSDQLRHF
jgi:hypothetical protein